MRKLAFATTLVLAAFAATGTAEAILPPLSAPGRIAIDVNGGAVNNTNGGPGPGGGTVVEPDGGALFLGGDGTVGYKLVLVRIDRQGVLVQSFGAGGIAHVDMSAARFSVGQVLRRPDGRLLLVGTVPPANPMALPEIALGQLTPAGTLDTSFGTGGFAKTGMATGCGACTAAALDPDGRVVLTGASYSPVRWVVARRTASGAADLTFGAGGTVTLPTPGATGFNVAVGADGRIVSEAQTQTTSSSSSSLLLTRLTTTGAIDPDYNGGNLITVPASTGSQMLMRPDGRVLVAGTQKPTPPGTLGDHVIVRYTAAGGPDLAFGNQGVADLGAAADVQQLLLGTLGTTLAVTTPVTSPTSLFSVRRIQPDGSTDPALGGFSGLPISVPFGGGESSFLISKHPRPLPTLRQNSFGADLVQRADGSYLLPGGVSVNEPTGEGEGLAVFRYAAASLTSAFTPDLSFGVAVPRENPTEGLDPMRVSLTHQRGSTAHARHGIRVRIITSNQGLARVVIRAKGKIIAQSVVPLFRIGAQTLPVELTKTGNAMLRQVPHHVRVSIAVSARDLFGSSSKGTAVGNLRPGTG